MDPSDIDVRIDYFHTATDSYLRRLGVDRSRLPTREDWRSSYREDWSRPVAERRGPAIVWEADGEMVGFSSADRIEFGVEARMHLHLLEADNRRRGLGTAFVRLSASYYFEVLRIERLYCEPNAFNVAPNRTLQKAGFRYLFTHESTPGPINFFQATTRWVMDRADRP